MARTRWGLLINSFYAVAPLESVIVSSGWTFCFTNSNGQSILEIAVFSFAPAGDDGAGDDEFEEHAAATRANTLTNPTPMIDRPRDVLPHR